MIRVHFRHAIGRLTYCPVLGLCRGESGQADHERLCDQQTSWQRSSIVPMLDGGFVILSSLDCKLQQDHEADAYEAATIHSFSRHVAGVIGMAADERRGRLQQWVALINHGNEEERNR